MLRCFKQFASHALQNVNPYPYINKNDDLLSTVHTCVVFYNLVSRSNADKTLENNSQANKLLLFLHRDFSVP